MIIPKIQILQINRRSIADTAEFWSTFELQAGTFLCQLLEEGILLLPLSVSPQIILSPSRLSRHRQRQLEY